MSGLYLPGAAWRPVSYRAESGLFEAGKPVGYIPHVQEGNGSLWAMFEHAKSPYRKFSNAWIAKDGRSEQYAENNRKPWAQADGNGFYRAYETEGFTSEPLTAAQINTLATWHNFNNDPDIITDSPGGKGIGTHRMGKLAYGGHSCPGDVRANQRSAILARALILRGAKPLPPVVLPRIPVTSLHPSGKIMLTVDGDFGVHTRMRLQQWAGAKIDSVLGPLSWKAIQKKLGNVKVDGDPGAATWGHLQKLIGAPVDGVPGPRTYRALQIYLNGH